MEVQQYTVTVGGIAEDDAESRLRHLQNINNGSISTLRTLTRAGTPQIVLINDIANYASQTVITVIVEDINDHDPVFAETELVVGYPDRDLLSLVSPAYITQVQVTFS